LVATLTTLLAQPIQAQVVSFSAAAAGEWVRNTLILQGVREETAGPWFGGSAELKLGPVVFGGRGLRGTLRPSGAGFAFNRTAGEVQALIRLAPVPWAGLEGSYTVRAYSSAAGYQRWDISALGIVLSAPLGHPAVRAYARGSALPSVYMGGDTSRVVFSTNGQSPGLRFVSEVGLKVAPSGVPLVLAMHYRFERYDFSGGSAGRLEQVDAVGVSVGFRAGR
jgi:hypothetical protein